MSGCACKGRAEGRHDLICENILRAAFGTVGDAPRDVQALLQDRGRIIPGTVVTPVGKQGEITMPFLREQTMKCPTCKGKKEITVKPVSQAEPLPKPVTCTTCKGQGRIPKK